MWGARSGSRELHRRILADDITLRGPARTVGGPAPAPKPAVEVHLPVRHTRLIGRDAERDRLTARLAAHPLVTIVGTAGCGKTRLSELAAARARAFTLDEIAEQVDTDASALARVGRARPEQRRGDHHRTVRFAVEQSYRMLPPDEAAVHRAVSVVPGPFTPDLAAALAGFSPGEMRELLARQ